MLLASSFWASLVAQMVNSLPAVGKTRVDPQAGKIPLRKEMAAPSSILAWKIPWTEEAGSPWGRKESHTTEWLH